MNIWDERLEFRLRTVGWSETRHVPHSYLSAFVEASEKFGFVYHELAREVLSSFAGLSTIDHEFSFPPWIWDSVPGAAMLEVITKQSVFPTGTGGVLFLLAENGGTLGYCDQGLDLYKYEDNDWQAALGDHLENSIEWWPYE